MNAVDRVLNSITMYRLALYALVAISLVAIGLSFTSLIFYNAYSLFLSAVFLLFSCYITNLVFSKALNVPVNIESSFITALILFLIMSPATTPDEFGILVLAGSIAIASKFLLAPYNRHIFNPAAFGVFFVFILGLGGAIWWVASSALLPIVLVAGLLVVRKIRRFKMFFAFLISGIVSFFFFNYTPGSSIIELLSEIFTSWPIIFFGTIMLTEPITAPPTKSLRIIYGILVGLLFGSQFHVWRVVPTPEFVLLVGNVFSYVVGFKPKLALVLKEKREIASNIFEFIFKPSRDFLFTPGQYLEYTLPHHADNRGNRRYFTIASSPTEKDVRLGVKINDPSSSFKKKLVAMQEGSKIWAGQLAGDFILPRDKSKKLAFLAGGIGITPFRSMVKCMLDTGQSRDVVLLYAVKEEAEIAYKNLFENARQVGLNPQYIVEVLLNEEIIKEKIPDYTERMFYISGPEGMVSAFKKILLKMGVARSDIITDYFPGFA